MRKYWQVFKISLEQELAYRSRFVVDRLRNVLQLFLIFFLWDSVFMDPSRVVFGYDKARILTYVFGLLIIRPIVSQARSVDIAGDVSSGRLTNYLLKPLDFFGYWFTRDVSSKSIHTVFALIEALVLYWLLAPTLFIQTDPIRLVLFVISLLIAMGLFFVLLSIFNMFPIWHPEQAWGPTFLLIMFVEFLGGGLFPIDVLPGYVQKIINSTPFPYIYYLPMQTYLGKTELLYSVKGVLIALGWFLVLGFALKGIWRVGLRTYRSEGR